MTRIPFLLVLAFHLSFSIGKIPQYEDTDDDYGGHSSEFKPMGHQWKMQDFHYTPNLLHKIQTHYKRTVVRPLADNEGRNANLASFMVESSEFFKALPSVLKEIEGNLERILKENRISGIVTGRIKSMASLLEKMEKDGIKDFRDITDIVGCRVTMQTIGDILKFKHAYLRAFNKSVTEIRCYGVCGPAVGSHPRVKIAWPWKGSGYRRLHFKVAIPELKTAAEIQTGTPYMTLWADWNHAVVYKGPEEFQQNGNVEVYSQLLAEYYMMLDNIRDGIIPQCPPILRKSNATVIFGDKDWKLFGSPLNACLFWNDLRTNMPV